MRLQRHGRSDGHCFLAGAFHVEGDAPLALGLLHAFVEQAREQHVPQPHLQFRRLQVRIPRTHRAVVIVQHAYQLRGQFHGGRHHAINPPAGVGSLDGARGREPQIAEVGRLPGPGGWVRDMETGRARHGEGSSGFAEPPN